MAATPTVGAAKATVGAATEAAHWAVLAGRRVVEKEAAKLVAVSLVAVARAQTTVAAKVEEPMVVVVRVVAKAEETMAVVAKMEESMVAAAMEVVE